MRWSREGESERFVFLKLELCELFFASIATAKRDGERIPRTERKRKHEAETNALQDLIFKI